MEKLTLTKTDVLAAFGDSRNPNDRRSPTFVMANEFNIRPQAVYQWSDGRDIPVRWQLFLYQNRPDIIQRVKEIQARRAAGLVVLQGLLPRENPTEGVGQ